MNRRGFLRTAVVLTSAELAGAFLGAEQTSASAAAAEPPASVDLAERARLALGGYLRQAPEVVPAAPGFRHASVLLPPFRSWIYPPSIGHDRWDWGDCTARAVQAWIDLREMTADRETGRDVETAQRAVLRALIDPKTGLVFQPASSSQELGRLGFHVWDQSRALRALVRWWESEPDARSTLTPLVDGMIRGTKACAMLSGVDPRWGRWAGWPSDEFVNQTPGAAIGWVNMRAGLLLDPIVRWWTLTGRRDAKQLALSFAHCTLGGHEGDRVRDDESRRTELTWVGARDDFAFAASGAFTGHFHTKSASLVGLARLGHACLDEGDRARGLRYLTRVREVFDWIFHEANENRGSRIGWFPEQLFPGRIREVSEVCCLSDMIELAALLAACADADSRLTAWADLYDDVEAMTVNTLATTQFRLSPRMRDWIDKLPAENRADAHDVARRLEGSWSAKCYPNDLLFTEHDGTPQALAWGCCAYAGTSGLHSAWRAVLRQRGRRLDVNALLTVRRPFAELVSDAPAHGSAELTLKQPAIVHVRMPHRLSIDALRASAVRPGERARAIDPRAARGGRYADLGAWEAGTRVRLEWPLVERTTREPIGGANRGGNLLEAGYSSPATKMRYTIDWRGNYVVRLSPSGVRLPIFPT